MRLLGALCGDGNVDDGEGEACDDGNLIAGDGCSPSCAIEACHTCAGAPSVCGPGPRPSCRVSLQPRKSPLRLTAGPSSARNRLVWSWQEGEATTFDDFGLPADIDVLALCLFDGSGAPVLMARAPAGGTCRTKPCWTASPVRYAYRDPERTPDGIDRLELLAAADGDARVYVKSKGPSLVFRRCRSRFP